ncbi:hypothetical protein ACWDRB_32330 [Nonomuraea sp. NPDC003707]
MDKILSEAGIQTVLTGIRMPRMNSLMERWVRSCRRELLDRSFCGTNATCSTLFASTNGSTTSTEPTKPWAKRLRHAPSRIRSRFPGKSST